MAALRPEVRRLIIGLGLTTTALLLGSCASKEKLLSNSGQLLYFQSGDSTVSVTPTASTTGGPTSSGDEVAWVLVNSSLTITSITFPAAGCGNSNLPGGWTPYQSPGYSKQFAWSGSLTPPPNGTSDGSWNLYYKITLSNGQGPCGRIIIKKGP